MSMRKTGSSEDQRVTETERDATTEENPQGIHKAAVRSGTQEPTPAERREIIDGQN
jgi:hypothetical protein